VKYFAARLLTPLVVLSNQNLAYLTRTLNILIINIQKSQKNLNIKLDSINLDINKVNINGGAIALGHPLGCTGSKLTVQILNDLERLNKKYGIVTACVGGGQGIAGIIERF
jgi:Kef-type K+ transport system membrane component KefB